MSVNLSIKNVPDALAESLRRRAEVNHRSLQGELMALLEAAVNGQATSGPATSKAIISAPFRTNPAAIRPLAEIYEEIRRIFPDSGPLPEGASAVEMIRADRDSGRGS